METLEFLEEITGQFIYALRWHENQGFRLIVGKLLGYTFGDRLRLNLEKGGVTFWATVDEVYSTPLGAKAAVSLRNDDFFRPVYRRL